MPDIRQMGGTAPLFEQKEIEVPARRAQRPMAETSKVTWRGKRASLNVDHMAILGYLQDHGPSVHDSIVAAGLVTQSSSGRMGELADKGLIEVCGRGVTRTGNPAKLCRITDAGRKAMREGLQL